MDGQGNDGSLVAPLDRLFLKSDVYAVGVGEDAVLLDIMGDAYHCVPGGAALCGALASTGVAVGEISLAGLAAAGLPDSSPPPTTRRLPPKHPARSIIHDRRPTSLVRDLVPAAAAWASVRRARRGRGLSPYLQLRERRSVGDDLDAIAAARRFWTLLPYLPIEGECLVRSALLMRFLNRQGLDADWIFGVRLHPFAAHCWVQAGDVCLNDDVERLWAYTPIMIVQR